MRRAIDPLTPNPVSTAHQDVSPTPTGDQPVACTTDGCASVKYFAGRCNPCQKAWEEANLAPLVDPYAGMSWAEECLAKVRKQ